MMSIIETFYILLKSDASEVKKGAEEAEKTTKKLQKSLNAMDKSSEAIGRRFLSMANAFAGIVASAVGVSTILGGLKSATDYAIELGFVSRQLGVNTAELDAWGNAIRTAGGTVQGFQQSLRGLSEHLGGSPQLALKVLPLLADTFEKLGKVRANQYGKLLGLDDATILLLQQGRREVERVIQRQRELGIVNEQDTKIALEFNKSVNETSHAFRSLYNSLAISALPALSGFLDNVTVLVEYLREHKDLIVGAFGAIAVAGAAFAAPIIAANAAVIALVASMTALVSVFAIFFEDYQAFKASKDSLIGEISSHGSLIRTISRGQSLLTAATNTPLSYQSSNSILNSSAFNRNHTLNIDSIEIRTNEASAPEIAKNIRKGIQDHLWEANNFFADGVVA